MRVGLCFDLRQARQWHRSLMARLTEAGHAVVIMHRDGLELPWVDRLLAFEGRLRGGRPASITARIGQEALGMAPSGSPDVVIDLDGDGQSEGEAPVWHLTADGAPGLGAVLRSAVFGHTPLIAVRHGATTLAAGRAGTESPGLLDETATDLLGRTAVLIVAALAGHGAAFPAAEQPEVPHLTAIGASRLAAAMTGRRFARRLERLVYRTPHWRVGWRKVDGPDLFDLRGHPSGGWRDLLDDGAHFYADPFPLLHEGVVTLFVEDYVHATGRGRISAVAFGPEGPLGRPEPVLERPYHLSYPFVFARDGEVWMIPETGEARAIELYRAARYPDRWVKEAALVSGPVAGDATLYEAPDGRWWMFATVKDGGAASDALHLWSAPDFRGPWTPHAKNPVLVDIASARPAGRVVMRGGALLRPVQDCRARYGAALGIARVLRLDDEGFSQNVETVIGPGPLWRGACLHTLNAAGGFEFIDGSGWARRPWREVGRG